MDKILGGFAPTQSARTAPGQWLQTTTLADAAPRGDSVSGTAVRSSQVHEGLKAFAGGAPIAASDVHNTDDYSQFLRQLESKYPNASGLDLNRAVRQHFYSDNGTKNSSEVFDKWLGKEGGQNDPALKGIEKDLQGLPSRINNPSGKSVDLSHMTVGIDAYYNHKTGRHGITDVPADAFKGVMLTHGGDAGQVFAATIKAAGNKLGISNGDETFSNALGYASPPELRGNQAGIEIGMQIGRNDRLSDAVAKQFR